jgi:hypothetical protein
VHFDNYDDAIGGDDTLIVVVEVVIFYMYIFQQAGIALLFLTIELTIFCFLNAKDIFVTLNTTFFRGRINANIESSVPV